MSNKWPLVGLGKLIVHRNEFIVIQDDAKYKRCRVQVHAQGIVLRDEVTGFEIRTKKQQVCRTNDFLVAEIDAKVGGYGIIPTYLDGAIVSSHYFLYKIDQKKLLTKYLEFFTKTKYFQDQVLAQGSTNYAAIRPGHVLNYNIPLPSLPEQRKIIMQIQNLSKKVEESEKLNMDIVGEIDLLFNSQINKLFVFKSGWGNVKVSDICYPPQYGYTESATYERIGPKFLRITDIQNGDVSWDSIPYCICPNPDNYLLKPSDILFARTGATTGKSFLIREVPEAVFASYLIRLRVKEDVLPEYLYFYFQTPDYWQQIHKNKEGTGQQNLNGTKLSDINVPVPVTKKEQQRIVDQSKYLIKKIKEIQELRSQTISKCEALIPSILDKAFKGRL
ncbi:MAG: restriction endonuclease subunit S [Elusimicrobia bacterium]|nr:restriction endonuclease subunit S [Elusimicrobiota bacterium]